MVADEDLCEADVGTLRRLFDSEYIGRDGELVVDEPGQPILFRSITTGLEFARITPAIEERAEEVQMLLADRCQHPGSVDPRRADRCACGEGRADGVGRGRRRRSDRRRHGTAGGDVRAGLTVA